MFAQLLLALELTPSQIWVGIASAGFVLLVAVLKVWRWAHAAEPSMPQSIDRASKQWRQSPHRRGLPSDLDFKVEEMWK